MAESPFDPLRSDPFAVVPVSGNTTNTNSQWALNNNTPNNGSNNQSHNFTEEEDVLLQFSNPTPTPDTNNTPNENDVFDVRKSRKERRLRRNSITSAITTSTIGSQSPNSRSKSPFRGYGAKEGELAPIDDPTIAPPPPYPIPKDNIMSQFMASEEPDKDLPKYELITHSGTCLTRISFMSLFVKRWKPTFWISYGKSTMLFFKSEATFNDWLTNVHISKKERDALVKLKLDFVKDLNDRVEGYQATRIKTKWYKKGGTLSNFKIDRWFFEGGPMIAGAFASESEQSITDLYAIMTAMMRRSTLNRIFMDTLMCQAGYIIYDDTRSSAGGVSVRSNPDYHNGDRDNYSNGAASY